MDRITLAISLPENGTGFDYQAAIVEAMCANTDGRVQRALSGLLACIRLPPPAHFNNGTERTTMVFGKF